ncbi:MAG TPA: amylo-alpha-1,6-glucosidase [Vicinamibacterales bacterium]
MSDLSQASEWLETDGLGGYASGTVGTTRTRRYHAVRVTATTPPTGRMVLVGGVEVGVDVEGVTEFLTSHHYEPGVDHPQLAPLDRFALDPWPTWTFSLSGGNVVRAELFCTSGRARTLLRWTQIAGPGRLCLRVRPLLAARDYHSLQRANDGACHRLQIDNGCATWRLYDGAPTVSCLTNGQWAASAAWYRQFLYAAERERGLDALEDLLAIGTVEFDLSANPAIMAVGSAASLDDLDLRDLPRSVGAVAEAERDRRLALGGRLEQSADQYFVRRGMGRTIVAGYPWFTDWGRDTFIALRGLGLATGRLDIVRDILLEWASAISQGMLPNRFPDHGEAPEYNAVDASLWYVVVAGELLAHQDAIKYLSDHDRRRLETAVVEILKGYGRGTRYGIRADHDGLLAAGEPGQQLTWMDARVGSREITPRIGKPVEIQALWINALDAGARISARWRQHRDRALDAFNGRFWDSENGVLFDVVDVDHEPGRVDRSIRPNQIFAVGGLPLVLVPPDRACSVVNVIERELWTPMGLRSLSPRDPQYRAHYAGGPSDRDTAYHQGTVWPWLAGPFVEAWLRVHHAAPGAAAEARERLLSPILDHLQRDGLGHVSEVADAEAPHRAAGCPFQAWSVGEILRISKLMLPIVSEPGRTYAAGFAVR